ncbi:carbohydrate ABC transporter permease [Ruania alba]|uniref:Carbohydrate ABC transporter membrane protein 1, CUT1 family n=1 Tax=Ruania alba TaxID=648782 RepID=A0A1H5GIC4_9MICO|nr:sugar ABC transporter permease [Ruania alba]SEE14888.1 carbohydrate ABC transporter membrane protein 1, CUT1 family [Ruania alba]
MSGQISAPGRGAPPSRDVAAGPSNGSRRGRKKWTFDRISFFIVFLLVPLALFLVFVISPFIQAGFYSLTNWTGFSPEFDFIGFANFVKLAQDPRWTNAVGNSIVLGLVVPFVTLSIALIFAILITIGGSGRGQIRGVKNAGFYRVVSLFPYVIPGIAIGLIWRLILDPSSGLVNGILTGLGLDQFQSFAWLGNVTTALPVSILVIVWGFVGFYMLLFIAAIKGIPAETYEAARIDGAGRARMSWSITLPLIRSNVQTAYIYIGIMALDAFVYMQALNPQGGPDSSTLVMSQQLFRSAFSEGQFGYASAMGVVIALVTLFFAAIVFTVNRLTGGKDEGGTS